MERRAYLAATGLAVSAFLAGCNSDPASDNNSSANNNQRGGGRTDAESGSTPTESTISGESAPATQADTIETTQQTQPATAMPESTATQIQTVGPSSGGASGSLDVTESELVTEEGEYSTDISMTALLENTGSQTLRLPEIKVSFYDDNDSVLDSTTRSIVLLRPGDRWDVVVPYLEDTTPARGEVEVQSAEAFESELGITGPLELANENLATGAEPQLSAELRNTSDEAISVFAYAVFYAEDNVALSADFNTLDGLAAGETWSVTLEPFIADEERADRITDHVLYANPT